MLLENVYEKLDPVFEPVVYKQIFVTAGTEYLKLGDAVIEYNSNFRYGTRASLV